MKTRLVALIDFSPQTETILKFTRQWSEIIDAEILLVHQVTYAVPALADNESRLKIIQFEKGKAIAGLNKIIAKYFGKNNPVAYEIYDKSLVNSLKYSLGKNYNDIVILGTKGSGVFKRYFMGSTALKVIDNLNCLVVTVPSDYEAHLPQTLTVSVTHKVPLNRNAFNNFLYEIHDFIELVRFISIVTPGENVTKSHDYLINLTRECQHNIPCTYDIFEGDSAFEEIKTFITENPNTMLVVQKGSRTITDQLFRKFFINDLVHNSSIPLIVVPN